MMAKVYFCTDSDEDATRITDVLAALGYAPLRDIHNLTGEARMTQAADHVTRVHKLTPRERSVLRCILQGLTPAGTAKALRISRSTVKYHTHNIFVKTGTGTRERLLRLALGLETK